jgi:hypothetical protein
MVPATSDPLGQTGKWECHLALHEHARPTLPKKAGRAPRQLKWHLLSSVGETETTEETTVSASFG